MDDRSSAILTNYLKLARRSWEDENFKQRLLDSPRDALADEGWELPEGVEVEVNFRDPESEAPEGAERLGPDEAAAACERAINDGTLRLLIPVRPPKGLETRELSDEQLESAVGGGTGEVEWGFNRENGFVIGL